MIRYLCDGDYSIEGLQLEGEGSEIFKTIVRLSGTLATVIKLIKGHKDSEFSEFMLNYQRLVKPLEKVSFYILFSSSLTHIWLLYILRHGTTLTASN